MALRTKVIYLVEDNHGNATYGVTDDGEGVVWYDTVTEAREQEGNYPVVILSDDEFESLRYDD